jgi:hypothetical protein
MHRPALVATSILGRSHSTEEPTVPRLSLRALPALALLALSATASAQVAYVDNHGREWRQLSGTTNRTWDQVAALCPTDGVTPCVGTLGSAALDGWTWANEAQVTSMLSDFVPEILTTPSLGGSQYVLIAMYFFGPFQPTWEYYTTFGGYNYLTAWTATAAGGLAATASASAQWPVFHGSFDVGALAATDSVSAFRGVWLYRQTPFSNLGHALPGTNGPALLKGEGSVTPGATTTLRVQNGAPSATALLAIGLSTVNAPVYGGTFVPSPDVVLAPLPLDAYGNLTLITPWPAGVPSGTALYLQSWFADGGAVFGVAATNAIRIDVP